MHIQKRYLYLVMWIRIYCMRIQVNKITKLMKKELLDINDSKKSYVIFPLLMWVGQVLFFFLQKYLFFLV